MRKRIFGNFIALVLVCVFCLSAAIIVIFYNAAKNKEIELIRDSANLAAEFINANNDDEYIDFISGKAFDTRITVVAPDGAVLLDSLTDAKNLENHADRSEVIEAEKQGSGESLRYSDTSKSDVYYYAVLLDDGNVLRVSRPIRSIVSAFTSVIPVIVIITAVVLIIARFVALRLTENIVKPLSVIDFNAENAVVYDELTPYIKKIEKQKSEIDAQICELKNRTGTINLISDNMKEGLLLISLNGTVLKANKSASLIFGADDITGEGILHICRETDFTNAVKRCLNGENCEIMFKRGSKIYSVFFRPSRLSQSGGEIDGAIILFFDSTSKAIAEKQRREFSANVSHELKTPLTTILGLSELIESGMAKKEHIHDFAGKITEQTRRLMDIIDDIIKLSEFDEGVYGKNDNRDNFGLYELASSVIASLSRKAEEKNVEVKLTGEEIMINADRLMLDEMLYNLIDNAVSYNNPGGSVTVDLSQSGEYRVITVTDTGIGIPEKHLDHVFERFYRVDKSRSKKTGGTGLGLSIVKHIAEEHGGKVEIKSEVGQGTEIKCFIKSRS